MSVLYSYCGFRSAVPCGCCYPVSLMKMHESICLQLVIVICFRLSAIASVLCSLRYPFLCLANVTGMFNWLAIYIGLARGTFSA